MFWAEDLGRPSNAAHLKSLIIIPASSSPLVFAIPGAVVLAMTLGPQSLSLRGLRRSPPCPCPRAPQEKLSLEPQMWGIIT